MKYPSARKLFLTALLSFTLFNTTLQAQSPQTISPVAVSPPAAASAEAAKRQEAFEIVWTTVKEQFYDQSFGGVDWDKVRERYAPRVAQAASNQELNLLLQQMLNELHQSHFLIIPPEAIPKFPSPDDADESQSDEADGAADGARQARKNAASKLTEKLTTGIGIDLRILDGAAVVTRVEPGSSAARAGLRPGYVIKRADGMSLDLVIEETLKNPTWQSIIKPELHQVLLAGYINGDSQSPVRLLYLDAGNHPRRVEIKREKLKGEMSPPIGNLPSMFTEFEAKRLANGIGYIRFNAFVPPVMDKLCGALRKLHDAPGLIIDLRGNEGGLIGMIGGLAGLVEGRQISLGSMQMRAGRNEFYTYPQKSPYTGALVILIDGSTQSAAEIFASGMRENDRAALVGEQSAGDALPSVIKALPTGALFQYGFANFRTRFGAQLEGHGVTPDVNVKLTRRALLVGRDPQLDAAVKKVKQRITLNASDSARTDDPVIRLIDDWAQTPIPYGMAVVEDSIGLPSVNEIFEKYLAAKGGRAALEKLTSRVTKGKAEISSMNLNGTVELYEKAPNKSVMNINVAGLGVMQRGFDGTKGWWQDSMRGYIRFVGYSLTDVRREAIFNRDLNLAQLYNRLLVTGKEKVNGREAYVLQELYDANGAEKLYFDVETGLLLRRGNTFYEDYREVDGVKLPFLIREESSNGFNFIFRVTEIKHNIAIDDATFAESPSCFTRAN
ncbi:MAG TPA: S41 family peptidase [Pyrinomonadaceae bacterium]|jgi:carboxyl-terminal processing protease